LALVYNLILVADEVNLKHQLVYCYKRFILQEWC